MELLGRHVQRLHGPIHLERPRSCRGFCYPGLFVREPSGRRTAGQRRLRSKLPKHSWFVGAFVPLAKRANPKLLTHHRHRACRAAAVADLGMSLMNNSMLITALTFVPLLGGFVLLGFDSSDKKF